MTTIVIDDDPTGTQLLADVPVLFEWTPETVRDAAARSPRAVFLLTNSRALSPEHAEEVVASAARCARNALPNARVLLRGDSTLRAHLLEEYRAICMTLYEGKDAVLLLVPALPQAGRRTLGGVHVIERGGRLVPLHETEYARDGVFAYQDARLLQWAEDRSNGHFSKADGVELHLDELRTGGPEHLAKVLLDLSRRGRPAACVPDVERDDDLVVVAHGLEQAEALGARVVTRCAPAFAGVLTGTVAATRVALPTTREGLLIVCGSYVPTTSRQLARLVKDHPSTLVEVDVIALASESAELEVERAAAAARQLLAQRGLAIVSTPRERPPETQSLEAGQRIASGLAQVVAALAPLPNVIVAKGGVTAATVARLGLGASNAWVVGPVASGVALWQLLSDDRLVDYIVVPGNVGHDDLLASIVAGILGA